MSPDGISQEDAQSHVSACFGKGFYAMEREIKPDSTARGKGVLKYTRYCIERCTEIGCSVIFFESRTSWNDCFKSARIRRLSPRIVIRKKRKTDVDPKQTKFAL